MNDKQIRNLLILAGIIIVIAVGATLLNALQSRSTDRFALTESVANDANKVQFNTPDSTFTLQRTDDKWKVDGVRADSERVNSFIDLLKASKVVSTASTNSNNYSLFNVDDENGTLVEFFRDDNKLTSIVIGKSLSNGNYIRFDGDSNVYQVNKSIDSSSELNSNEFKDKSLSAGDINNLSKVVTKDFQINTSSEGYKLENNSTQLDQTKTQSFLNSLINIKAVDIASEDQIKSIEDRDPNINWEVYFNNGNTFKFDLYAIDDDNVLAKRDDGVVLTLYRSQFDNINVSIDKLKQS